METSSNELNYENVIIGITLLNNKVYDGVQILKPNMFQTITNKMIWKAILSSFEKNKVCDMLNVHRELKIAKSDISAYELSTYTNQIGSASEMYAVQAAKVIVMDYIRNSLLVETNKLMNKIPDSSLDPLNEFDKSYAIVQQHKDYINSLSNSNSLGSQVNKLEKQVNDAYTGLTDPYISTGYNQLDKVQNGLTPGDLICIAARPGMGKTAFVLSLAKNVVQQKNAVAIFSLEMTASSLLSRLAASIAGINAQLARNPKKMSPEEKASFDSALKYIKTLPLHIIDESYITERDIQYHVRRLKKSHDIKLVIVDYLQLCQCSDSRATREQQISQISRSLKIIAKDEEVTVVELSQLSRAVESRGGEKEPILSDLRESGSIEQDADIVSFIYRPAYYDIYEDASGNDLSNIVKYIIRKNRHGPLENVYLYFDKYTTAVHDSKLKLIEINHQTDLPKSNYEDPFKL